MALPWQTFSAKNVIKEVCFLFILAESMLKNTITNIPTNKKYAALSQHRNI